MKPVKRIAVAAVLALLLFSSLMTGPASAAWGTCSTWRSLTKGSTTAKIRACIERVDNQLNARALIYFSAGASGANQWTLRVQNVMHYPTDEGYLDWVIADVQDTWTNPPTTPPNSSANPNISRASAFNMPVSSGTTYYAYVRGCFNGQCLAWFWSPSIS
jgi:hypothetical protein